MNGFLMGRNKVAIISGAAGGLGSILANSLWELGYSLGLIIRPSASLENLNLILSQQKKDQQIFLYKYDLAVQEDLHKLVKDVRNSFQKIDVLLNVAGIHGNIGPVTQCTLDEWRDTFAVNLDAPMFLSSKLAPMIISGGGGSIINFSGGGATGVRENFAAYASSKTALVRFSEILAAELAGMNVSVNCISPGILPTRLLQEIIHTGSAAGAHELEAASKALSKGDAAAFDRVIRLVSFLIGPVGSRITGKLLSAVWDNWEAFPGRDEEIVKSEIFTLRRLSGKNCYMDWADK